jgi:hypothetical protein
VDRTARWLPRLYPYIPRRLRYVGPFYEAEARLSGRTPGVLTRQSNCFWMGQPRLLYEKPLPQTEVSSRPERSEVVGRSV